MKPSKMSFRARSKNLIIFSLLCVLAALFLFPIALVVLNSFKSKFLVSAEPFALLNSENFVGFQNYLTGLKSSGFFASFLRSVFVTVFSVGLITLCSAMTSYYIVRIKNKFTKTLSLIFAFSMIVPFQMVMYTLMFIVNRIYFDNILGIIFVYLGFGAGLSVFIFTGFVSSVPIAIEEAAQIDGCNPLQTFFIVVFPLLKPSAITVALLNAMWIWNDYLLPYLVLGSDNKTVPIAIQLAMQGAYGATDYGGLMAMLVLAVIPIIFFYVLAQKHIIEGVTAGAVKG